ncbi:unnamed protein product [Peniophora sp. CBMAI 1063]|nr:unnamed protein product [Peniophora sp. CBMAI 1063]
MTDTRPYKRRKTASDEGVDEMENFQMNTQRFVLEQIDLEIGIRRRLEETVNSRMAWALQLQQSLRAGHASQAFLNDDSFDYRTLAFEALHAAEAPILPVLSHEALPSRTTKHERSTPNTHIPTDAVTSTPAPLIPDVSASDRVSSRSTRNRGQVVGVRAPTKKLMYLRNTAENPPTLAKLVCPDCSRSDMTNVQGLYNHCRLRHKREFGSHEECIRATAVKVAPEEEAWVIENGIELPGVSLPSLRSLFEMAVGVDNGGEDHSPSPAPRTGGSAQGDAPATGTHLSRTLGHHIDTPALAPFLGRDVKRRTITVHEEDADVDIENVSRPGAHSWRKPYVHRSKAVPALDVSSPEPGPEARVLPWTSAQARPEVAESSIPSTLPVVGSRFHFTARINVGDRSLWLPPRSRESVPEGHTHRCMIYVDSPSYSLHTSAFISHLSVRSLTDPSPSTLKEPATCSTYPFAVLLTTDRPFLAELTLSFVGERNPDVVIQHWIELDPFKHEKSVLGDEQVIDLELDRSTQYRDPQPHINPVDILNASKQRVSTKADSGQSGADEIPPYVRLLKSLLPRFPMTSRDARGVSVAHLPYMLLPSSQALRALVDGRRKAIERARAQALCEAYAKARASMSSEEASNYLDLSIADVYIWLEDGGHFLRPPPVQPSSAPTKEIKPDTDTHRSETEYCAICGVNTRIHPQVKSEDGSLQPPALCPFAPPTPHLLVLDPLRNLSLSDKSRITSRAPPGHWLYTDMDVLQAIDPRVIDATSRISGGLHLPQALTTAGSATLALATRAFLQRLLQRAESLAYNDRSHAPGAPSSQLLTPAHIHRAMNGEEAMRIVGSVLGSVRSYPAAAARPQSARPAGDAAVKQEVEE